jgi:hypothetical protein
MGQAVLGGAGGLAGGIVGKGLQRLGFLAKGLPEFAETQALRAARPTATELGKLNTKDIGQDVGRFMLEEGLLKGEAGEGAAAAKGIKDRVGSQIGDMLTHSKEMVEVEPFRRVFANLAVPSELEQFPASWRKPLAAYADVFAKREWMTVSDLAKVKTQIQGAIDASGRAVAPQLKEARDAINAAMEAALPQAQASSYSAAKGYYGLAKEAHKLLARQAAKEELNPGGILASVAKDPFAVALGVLHPGAAAAYLANRFAGAAVRSGNIARAADYLSTTWVVKKLAEQAEQNWGAHIGSLLSGTAREFNSPTLKDYDRLAENVSDAAQNPHEVLRRTTTALGQDLTDHHPEVATQALLQAQQGIAYLEGIRPKPSAAPAMLDTTFVPSDHEKASWLDAHRAVADPASVLSYPTPAGIAAVKAVYPQSYGAMMGMIQERLTNARTRDALTYAQKAQLAQHLGPGVSTLTDGQLIASMQQSYAAQAQQGQAPKGQANSARTQRARQMKLKSAEQDKTLFNRIQERAS